MVLSAIDFSLEDSKYGILRIEINEREHIWKQIMNSAKMRFEAHPGDALPVNFIIKIPKMVNTKTTIKKVEKINNLETTDELKTERPFNP